MEGTFEREVLYTERLQFLDAGLIAHFAEQMKKGISELSEYFE